MERQLVEGLLLGERIERFSAGFGLTYYYNGDENDSYTRFHILRPTYIITDSPSVGQVWTKTNHTCWSIYSLKNGP
jgi:hypothetical protein